MPTIVIDDHEIEVPSGTKIIEAAERLGIMIPRFCYHPALGSVGACRVCAVKFLEGPFKGVQMSCMIEAKDGMVISTTDEEAVDFRKYVIEWLMLNHPHDCPVCDEGGHCLLQDMTVSGGHGLRRYLGLKRTYRDQYLGPLVQHEMNRCIHCYRCARFYQEFTGYRDLGVMQIGNRTYFGRFKDGVLESPFTGNLSDICPTGVYTDKPARFFGRRWDFQRSSTVCINCSLGCHTTSSARYREVVRQEARFSEAINGYFICDRGRYGFDYARIETRPRQARAEGVAVPYDEAIRIVSDKLAKISENGGPKAITCAGSWRSSLETLAMLKRLCQMKGWEDPLFFLDRRLMQKVKTAVSRLEPAFAISLREIEGADFIFLVGADPINEAPMLALAMRQAQREGARVVAIDPRPISLPFPFLHLPVAPDDMNLVLSSVIKGAVDRDALGGSGEAVLLLYEAIPSLESVSTPFQGEALSVAQELRQSQRPVIVCGTEIVRETTPALAADHAILLQAAKKEAGLFFLMPGANAFGAAVLSGEEEVFTKIIDGIENDTVRALILAEADPFWHFYDRQRLGDVLEKLDLLVVLDYMSSPSAEKAHVFLPTATLYESGGIFINQEGRAQVTQPSYQGGSPLAQTSGGSHPPRAYGSDIPGGEIRPAWQALAALGDDLSHPPGVTTTREDILTWLAGEHPLFSNLPSMEEASQDGIRLDLSKDVGTCLLLDWLEEKEGKGRLGDRLELLLVDWTFGTEELSVYSPHLAEVGKEPCMFIHADDAARLSLSNGDRVSVKLDGGALEVHVSVDKNMASGVIVLPRHRELEWRKVKTVPTWVGMDQIKRIS
jgi:NADH-quinone oxidoreductase subunit G